MSAVKGGSRRTRVKSIKSLDQGYIVGMFLLVLCLASALFIDGFASSGNILDLARSGATLGILAIGGMVVVIARGLDLSVIAISALSSAFAVQFVSTGHNEVVALLLGLAIAMLLGLFNGLLVAYVDIPPLFVTLATTLLFFGVFRLYYLTDEIRSVPEAASIMQWLGRESILGVPNPVILFALVATGTWLLLKRNLGAYLYASGDNPDAARLAGLPLRPMLVGTYVFSAFLAFLAGVNLVSITGTYDLRTAQAGSLLYDVIAVIVIGGVSLSGGRGKVLGVVSAVLLIAVIKNTMTLLDFGTIQQSLAKALIVLIAICLDSALHPRDEETARVGDL